MNSQITRRLFVRRSLGFAASTVAITKSSPSLLAAEAPARFKLGTLVPRGSSYFNHLQMMSEQWRKAPEGGIALTTFPDGTQGSDADMVRRMRVGQLNAGLLTAVGLAEIEPSVGGLQSIPMMFRSLDEVDHVNEKLTPIIEKRMEQRGFIVLCWVDAAWVHFFSKQPLLHPADLKKMKLFTWAGSTDTVNIYRSAGFNPVPLETADILTNLKTSLIDAVPMPPYIAMAGQFDIAAPHMLALNWAPLVGALVVSRKSWDALPASTREAAHKAAQEEGRRIKADSRKEAVDSVKAMKKRGLKVQEVAPDVEAEWRTVAEAAYPQVRGRIVPADIFDTVVKVLQDYRAARGARP
ncbi:MAG: C4-dicarboxylate ABC transporter substrate-binding protein [Pedosphaera sp.]|nr:C4-dicarboxylate ABC transporter substrate-binding protein [Pedosphaera sp.]